MDEVKELPKYLSAAQLEFINQKTPKQFIKSRPGPGGSSLNYVEVGYVINALNQAFGFDWDFRVLEQQIGKNQLWVKGELTVRVRGHSIVKGQYGGAGVKNDIADDLKAAASDCLKKCASMIGIASDVYWPELDLTVDESNYPQQRGNVAYSQRVSR